MPVTPGYIGMRKPRPGVAGADGGWRAFVMVFYNARGWLDRAELIAMARMGIRRYDAAAGELVGTKEA